MHHAHPQIASHTVSLVQALAAGAYIWQALSPGAEAFFIQHEGSLMQQVGASLMQGGFGLFVGCLCCFGDGWKGCLGDWVRRHQ